MMLGFAGLLIKLRAKTAIQQESESDLSESGGIKPNESVNRCESGPESVHDYGVSTDKPQNLVEAENARINLLLETRLKRFENCAKP